MKKIIAPLTAVLPLLYILAIGLSFLFHASDPLLFCLLGVYLLLTLLFTVCFYFTIHHYQPKQLAMYNILFSAGNLLLLLMEAGYWLVKKAEIQQQAQSGAAEGGLLLLIWIILYLPHWFSYFMVRIAGMVSCNRSLEGICSTFTRLLHDILHFLPAADLISSIWVLYKVSTWQKAQNNT